MCTPRRKIRCSQRYTQEANAHITESLLPFYFLSLSDPISRRVKSPFSSTRSSHFNQNAPPRSISCKVVDVKSPAILPLLAPFHFPSFCENFNGMM